MSETKTRTRIRIAEFATLSASVVLLIAVVVFLVREMMKPTDEFNEIRIRASVEKAVKRGSLFVFPVTIENLGQTTVSNVAIRVEPLKPGENPHDFSLDYLGVRAEETVFVMTESDPRDGSIRIRPLHYQIE